MGKGFLRGSAAVSAVAAVVGGLAAPAQAGATRGATASATAGWRIVATYPKSSIVEMAAGSANNMWAVQSCASPCSRDRLVLHRWNGTTWQAEPQPADNTKTGSRWPELAIPPGSQDVFAFYDEYRNVARPSVVEWTGTSWTARTYFTPNSTNLSYVAASPSDVWAFSIPYPVLTVSPAVHYNGKAWAAAPSPGFNASFAAATSPTDIWTLGEQVAYPYKGYSASRWNGKKWIAVPLPSAAPKAPHQVIDDFQGLVVGGPDDVWTTGYEEPVDSTVWMLHWNGKAWSDLRIPYALNTLSYQLGAIGPDGHGGVWLDANAKNGKQYLYHGTAAGHWQQVALPALKGAGPLVIWGFTGVPGGTSVYAYGAAPISKTQSTGVILKYGA